MDQRKIAITQASGVLAEAILEKLAEAGVSPDGVDLLDDESRIGVKIPFGEISLPILDQQNYDFTACSLVLMLQYDEGLVSQLSNLDALVLSHAFGGDEPPVYAADKGANLNVSYTQQSLKLADAELSSLLGVLPALHAANPITQINAVFLRSAESWGKAGIDELASQTVKLLNAQPVSSTCYPVQIAFNLIPVASRSGLNFNLARALGNEKLACIHQIVDVPTFHGYGIAVQLKFSSNITVSACSDLLSGIHNVQVKTSIASPITDCNQSFSCVITQLEQVPDEVNTIQFWMIVDPLRFGLANNYANVSDILLKSFL